MKTGDLIETLTQDAAPPPPLWRMTSALAIAGAAVAIVLLLLTLGVRPNVAAAMQTTAFQIKMGLFAAITALMAADYYRLMRPGARQIPLGILASVSILGLAAVVQLALVPSSEWQSHLFGGNWKVCLRSVPFLALTPLAAAIVAMRAAAPGSPTLAGVAAGGLAAAVSATIYAVHCPADTPIFYAAWYSIGGAAVIGLGAVAGKLSLKW